MRIRAFLPAFLGLLAAAFADDPAGQYAGLVSAAPGGDPHGMLTLKVSPTDAFTGRLEIDGVSYAVRGAFDALRQAQVTATNRNGTATLDLALDPGSTPQIAVALAVGTARFSATARHAEVNATGGKPERKYGVVFPPDPANTGSTAFPQAFGYVDVKVFANGATRISGKAGDGTALHAASVFVAGRTVPLHVSLYRQPRGAIYGTLDFAAPPADSDVGGVLVWTKPAQISPGKLYPAGFTTPVTVFGSRYVPPGLGQPTLGFGAGGATMVQLSDGNLPAPVTANATMMVNTAATLMPPLTMLKFSTPYGVMSAAFTHPLDGRARKVWGIALQNRNEAFGGFVGTDQSGPVTVNAP